MNKKYYNTTDLIPQVAFEKHIYHRDQFAHYLRWSHILKVMRKVKGQQSICDFGCGRGSLAEVIYRNRCKVKSYTGIDIRNVVDSKLRNLDWVNIIEEDIINPFEEFDDIEADIVCSFEVAEHVGKQNINKFLENFKSCGNDNATYYLSTPNYDEQVGAAGNHTFNSNDGRGKAVQEFTHHELEEHIIDADFRIIDRFGTFASIKDYKDLLSPAQKEVFEELREYYDINILSVMMAPMFPRVARNCLWILERDNDDF